MRTQIALIALAASLTFSAAALAAPPAVTDETLDANSTYTRQDCLGICACVSPPHSGPLTGTFVLRFNHRDLFTEYYDVTDVQFLARPEMLASVLYGGTGSYEIGGDFALTHRLRLALRPIVDPPSTPPIENYDSGNVVITAGSSFPAIRINLTTAVIGCTERRMSISTTASVRFCAADFNRDNAVTVQDIFDFLAAYFTQDPRADLNNSGSITVEDIFDFLAAYFAPC